MNDYEGQTDYIKLMEDYKPIMQYKGQTVYYEPLQNKVFIEREQTYLTVPNIQERRELITMGLTDLILKYIKEKENDNRK